MRKSVLVTACLVIAVGLGAVSIEVASDTAVTAAAPQAEDRALEASEPSSAPVADEGEGTSTRSPAPTPQQSESAPQPRTLDELYAQTGVPVPDGPVERAGCPPPPAVTPPAGEGGSSTPWSPPATVPDSELPAPLPPVAWTPSVEAIEGTGMWIWQYGKTENENFQAIVDRAVAAKLDHLWIRVGDSRDGFYAGERMNTLVPLAHAAGLKVIGWGFPFLHDPVADAAWSREAMQWRGPHGRGLDGFSPDIETSTEGVKLSAERTAVYLGLVRRDAGPMPVFATVYPAVDWVVESGYPYETIAPYVDAFVPMAYWMCAEPGEHAAQSLRRLRDLRPVHMIGQAYHNTYHGRRVPPSAAETYRFLDTSVREGAVGASLWVWQDMGQEQWDALASYPWHRAVRIMAGEP